MLVNREACNAGLIVWLIAILNAYIYFQCCQLLHFLSKPDSFVTQRKPIEFPPCTPCHMTGQTQGPGCIGHSHHSRSTSTCSRWCLSESPGWCTAGPRRPHPPQTLAAGFLPCKLCIHCPGRPQHPEGQFTPFCRTLVSFLTNLNVICVLHWTWILPAASASRSINHPSSFSLSPPLFKKAIYPKWLVKIFNIRSVTRVASHNQLPPATNCNQLLLPQVHLRVSIVLLKRVQKTLWKLSL